MLNWFKTKISLFLDPTSLSFSRFFPRYSSAFSASDSASLSQDSILVLNFLSSLPPLSSAVVGASAGGAAVGADLKNLFGIEILKSFYRTGVGLKFSFTYFIELLILDFLSFILKLLTGLYYLNFILKPASFTMNLFEYLWAVILCTACLGLTWVL